MTASGNAIAADDVEVILLFHGPVYFFDSYHAPLVELLSHKYSGELWTHGPNSIEQVSGRFALHCLKNRFSTPLCFYPVYLAKLALWALSKRRESPRRSRIVWTYDPLLNGLIGLFLAKLLGAKLAIEVNGVYTNSANFLDSEKKRLPRMRAFFMLHLARFVLRKADGVKLLFPEQIEPMRADTRRAIVEAFPCFVATEKLKCIREDPVVLFVGFPFLLKGVDLLLQAFARVRERFPEWRMTLIGHGLSDAIKRMRLEGYCDRVEVLPGQKFAVIAEHMGSCAMLVLPSRTEGMGRVLIEAAACGKPRIGSDIEGIPTVIDNGIDGLLFPPGDVDALARAMERLMGDAKLRRQMGAMAMHRSSTTFSGDQFLRNVVDFADRILIAPTRK